MIAAPPPAPTPNDPQPADAGTLAELRALLRDRKVEQIDDLGERVTALEAHSSDPAVIVARVTPVLGEAIRHSIAQNRAEMIEALYPIIGQLISRAVAEAMRDLVRLIDARMRTSFNLSDVMRRLRARISGVPDAALALRDALPFQVNAIFLIHRETGLLLRHLAVAAEEAHDSDLISGMLTAIRDFTQDAFGRGREGQLDEIQYGTRRILIETAQHAYLAVVVDGIEPSGFRATVRQHVMQIEHEFAPDLRRFDGDAAHFAATETALKPLLTQNNLTPTQGAASDATRQKRLLIGLAGLLVACLLASCAAAALGVRAWVARPPVNVFSVVTATPAPSPSATATSQPPPHPANTPTPESTSTPTPQPTATAPSQPPVSPQPAATLLPIIRVRDARVTVHLGPGAEYSVMAVAEAGRVLAVIGRDANGDWWQVCCVRDGLEGWVEAQTVSVTGVTKGLPIHTGP